MNYTVSFIWSLPRFHQYSDSFRSALSHYQRLHKEHLLNGGILLPVADPKEWCCGVDFGDEMILAVTFYSILELDEFCGQMRKMLIPMFADRLEIAQSSSQELGLVSSN
jgi:glutamate-1-semialdehyde aminotransferase